MIENLLAESLVRIRQTRAHERRLWQKTKEWKEQALDIAFGMVIAKRIEELGLPASWKNECGEEAKNLRQEELLQECTCRQIADALLILLCRKYEVPTPKALRKQLRTYRGVMNTRRNRVLNDVEIARFAQ
jgi:hypothetical protein